MAHNLYLAFDDHRQNDDGQNETDDYHTSPYTRFLWYLTGIEPAYSAGHAGGYQFTTGAV